MNVRDLIQGLASLDVRGNMEREIMSVSFDSREIRQGSMYVALKGVNTDGHKYIVSALEAGAVAVVCEVLPEEPSEDVCWITVEDSRKAIAWLAASWYGHPSRELNLIGVTGTNGKTTIATLLYKVHNAGLGYKAGILSTIEVRVHNEVYPSTHTTPDPLQLNEMLRKMVNVGCEYCFMEVSSHAASQHRTFGLDFDGAIFTNLTHDHLDYHKDFRSYLEAKKSFFDGLKKEAFALHNLDDKNGKVMVQNCASTHKTFSLSKMSDFRGKIMEMYFEGTRLELDRNELWVRLTGAFNVSNVLAVYGACMLLGHEKEQILEALSIVDSAEGRFEVVKGDEATAIVDYAHTDDALKNVLQTIHEINAEQRTIVTVVGAGGDRDKEKRPKMAAIAALMSSKVVLTSDNPRSEDPAQILREMEAGVPGNKIADVLKIQEREEAIRTACMLAGDGIVLIAGKGHEKYQVIGDQKLPFDDKEIVKKYLK